MDTPSSAARAPRPGGARPAGAPGLAVPPGHIGRWVVPGSGQVVWWTGRVAIGLRHEPR
jgi:hypothetical protein